MVFSAPGGRWYHAPRSEGGVGHHSDKKCGKAAFLYLSHFAVLIYYESARPASDAGERLRVVECRAARQTFSRSVHRRVEAQHRHAIQPTARLPLGIAPRADRRRFHVRPARNTQGYGTSISRRMDAMFPLSPSKPAGSTRGPVIASKPGPKRRCTDSG